MYGIKVEIYVMFYIELLIQPLASSIVYWKLDLYYKKTCNLFLDRGS